MAPKSRFASRGAFDALALEDSSDVEQDQHQEVQEETSTPEPTVPTNEGTPSKNTRSARRSAKRTANRGGGEVATPDRGTDSEADLEVMTTRSGSRIRQPSVPHLAEETSSSNGKASNGQAKEASEARPSKAKAAESEKGTATIMAPVPKIPESVTQKAADENPGHAQMTQKKIDEEIEARKVYWKKIYERTIFTFIMIGGFIGESEEKRDVT